MKINCYVEKGSALCALLYLFVWGLMVTASAGAYDLYVSPVGSDANPGTSARQFATLEAARAALQESGKLTKEPCRVILREGVYRLTTPFRLAPEDSGAPGAPVTYAALEPGKVVLSGGLKLTLDWKPYRDGILRARVAEGLVTDQLFVNGKRQHMARYPNFDPKVRHYNGFAADAFSPERASRWADPVGGFMHVLHGSHWGGYHYLITGKKEDNTLIYEGGWQNNRKSGMHKTHRFVENIFEELDAPGEWFHDRKTQTLYYYPPDDVDIATATFEVTCLKHLVEFRGTQETPVHDMHLKGLVLRHTARTFMETREPLLRSDWTIYRGGAALFDGAVNCSIRDCEFDQVGGNAVFVNNYNRNITVQGCHIHGAGASGICFVGNPDSVRNPLFQYHQRQSYNDIDKTPGPKGDDFPADCLVDDCLIHNISVVEKQATGVQISMSRGITVRHCSIYDVGRAGINISEGTFGGHIIEFCDVFDTVRETGDHGSFNSWGRDRYWGLKDVPEGKLRELSKLDTEKTIIRNSRWRCDHGWDVDLDDGSSHYEIYNNLFLRGGLKLREGFDRLVYNNISPNNTLHPHVWYKDSHDVVTNNIWGTRYRPAGGRYWGKEIDRNMFTNESDRKAFETQGCDMNSIVGDPMFVDPASGDYRVMEGSPALKMGFKNFPMDKFGVQKPELKALARTPQLPGQPRVQSKASGGASEATKNVAPDKMYWNGALLGGITGEEYSAFGTIKEDGGLEVLKIPERSIAERGGLKEGDLIAKINGKKMIELSDLLKVMGDNKCEVEVVRGQSPNTLRFGSFVSIDVLEEDVEVRDGAIPIDAVKVQPGVNNRPPETLCDGQLARNFGPVFANKVVDGRYELRLKQPAKVREVHTISFRQSRSRVPQVFDLSVNSDTEHPVCTVDTRNAGSPPFLKTIVRFRGEAAAEIRSMTWTVRPPNGLENTVFQEMSLYE